MENNNQIVNSNNSNMYSSSEQIVTDNTLKILRSTKEAPFPYSTIFARYPYFNMIQSIIYPHIMESNDNLVVASPTGSGKTLLFELAMVNLLQKNKTEENFPFIMVYVAPLKALCEERFQDWHMKFGPLGIKSITVTGDSDDVDSDITFLSGYDIIITTPEKWDSLSRRYKENKKLISLVKLFMIDEIHLINDETRGPAIEAIVSRMKIIQSDTSIPIRFIALSATIPNIEDVSEWMGTAKKPAKYFRFGEDMRPVKLKKIVLGYPYNSQMSSPFKFDIMLSYKLQNIIMQYSDGKPTLIFCSTRKSTEMTAKQVVQQLTINLSLDQKKILQEAASQIYDKNLKETLIYGVGMHHAGITREDRDVLQDTFRNGHLPVLIATSTLAMGINLPAHLVIIKSTKYYAKGEYKDHSESTILQMIGRAGRPQFDTNATAVIMTTSADKHKYENMVGGSQPVESSLHKNLIEHLNAEVVLHTITDLSLAVEWLASTFLYIRARKNPKYYGLPYGLDSKQLDNKLLELCQIEINKLVKEGMLVLDENVAIKPTRNGYLMAKYCIHFQTFKLFGEISGKEIPQQILSLVSKSHEYSEMYLRTNDKKCLNLLNHCRDKETIRYPLSGKIKTLEMKINCLIQAVLGSLPIMESSLITEAQKIIRTGERIINCLAEYLESMPNCFSALLSTVILNKCFRAQLWENSTYITKQLPKIGTILSKHLSDSGRKTFDDILKANPRDLERIINKKAPFGNDIQEQIKYLPKYQLELKLVEENCSKSVHLSVTLVNADDLTQKMTVDKNSYMILIVGDDENNILHYVKYKHSYMKENSEIAIAMELHDDKIAEIKAHFVSEDWVGIDCQQVLVLKEKKDNDVIKMINDISVKNNDVKPNRNVIKKNEYRKNEQPSKVQKFMDLYFKTKKRVNTVKINKPKPKKTIQRTISQLMKETEKKKSEMNAQSFFSKLEKDIEETYSNTTNQANCLVNAIQHDTMLVNEKDIKKVSASISKIEEFEMKLLESPQKKVLDDFTYVEPPKLNHAKEVKKSNDSSHPDSTTTTKTPPLQQETSLPVHKTITWKSPLVSYHEVEPKKVKSPPKTIVENNLLFCKNIIKDLPTIKVPSLATTIKRIDSDNFVKNFPLSDEQCKDKLETKTTIEKSAEEIVSLKLLEELGLSNFNNANNQSTSNNSEIPTTCNKVVKQKFQDTTEYFSLLEPTNKLADLQNAIKTIEKSNIQQENSTVIADTTTDIIPLNDSSKSLFSQIPSDLGVSKEEITSRNETKSVQKTNVNKRNFDIAFPSKDHSNGNISVETKNNKLDAINVKLDCLSGTRLVNLNKRPDKYKLLLQNNSIANNPFAVPMQVSVSSTNKSRPEYTMNNRSLPLTPRYEQRRDHTSMLLPSNTQINVQHKNYFQLANEINRTNENRAKERAYGHQPTPSTSQTAMFGFDNPIETISNHNVDNNVSLSLFDEDEELDMNEVSNSIFNYTPSQYNLTQEVSRIMSGEGFNGNMGRDYFNIQNQSNLKENDNMGNSLSCENKYLFNNSTSKGLFDSSCGECRCCNGRRNAINFPTFSNHTIPTNPRPNSIFMEQRNIPYNMNHNYQAPMEYDRNFAYGNFAQHQSQTNTLPLRAGNSQQLLENGAHTINNPPCVQNFHNAAQNVANQRRPSNFQAWLSMQKMNKFPFNQN